MATCDSCEASAVALVAIDSWNGEFRLCRLCYVEPELKTKTAKARSAPKRKAGNSDSSDPLFGWRKE